MRISTNSQIEILLTRGVQNASKLLPKGKVCAGCLPEHQERQLEMWEVIAKSPTGHLERRIVTSKWERVEILRDRAHAKNWRVKIRQYMIDLFVADAITGDYLVLARRISPRDAAKYSMSWIKQDRDSGCVWWPHGSPLPVSWKVAFRNETL